MHAFLHHQQTRYSPIDPLQSDFSHIFFSGRFLTPSACFHCGHLPSYITHLLPTCLAQLCTSCMRFAHHTYTHDTLSHPFTLTPSPKYYFAGHFLTPPPASIVCFAMLHHVCAVHSPCTTSHITHAFLHHTYTHDTHSHPLHSDPLP